jgi:N-acetylneuraminate synthase
VIEKHFTDDRNGVGNDHYHAFDEALLREYVASLATFRRLAGDGTPDIEAQSTAIENARRRIFVTRDLEAGAVVAEGDLIALRANSGLEIAAWDSVVGRRLAVAKQSGDAVLLGDLSEA